MADTPKAYKLNKEKRAVEENGKFLYYFYDRKRLTSVALPEEQFDKLVEMDREYYNLERRENDHKTTFKKSANTNGYKKIDIEKDDFGQACKFYLLAFKFVVRIYTEVLLLPLLFLTATCRLLCRGEFFRRVYSSNVFNILTAPSFVVADFSFRPFFFICRGGL